MYRVYIKGNYLFFVIVATGELYDVHVNRAEIQKTTIGSTTYTFSDDNRIYQKNIALANIVKEDDSPYTAEEFEAFRTTIENATGSQISPNVINAVDDGSLIAGKSAYSFLFRGTGGTFNGVAVPDNYYAAFALNAPDKLGSMTYTIPTAGEMRIIITTL